MRGWRGREVSNFCHYLLAERQEVPGAVRVIYKTPLGGYGVAVLPADV
jgi:hypothetical protein